MNLPSSNRRFAVLLVLLLAAGGFIHGWQRAGEASVSRRPLREFPATLGEWRQNGSDERFAADIEQVLRADDYVSRFYTGPPGTVSFYVGYYASQRHGATYHSPLNCLPGAGWVMSGHQLVTIQPSDGGTPITANRYLISNGDQQQLLLYWYQGRGRAIASEYWGKIFTVLDSVRQRRSDGALVRVMMPVQGSEEQTARHSAQFAAEIIPRLSAFIPD
jgi:EpsI family protein